jgi:hypothetical protein
MVEKRGGTLVLRGEVAPVTLVYSPAIISIVRDMKNIQSVEETLKSDTWERLEKISDKTSSRVSFLLESAIEVEMDFLVRTPKLVVPLKGENESCWVVAIEELHVRSLASDK